MVIADSSGVLIVTLWEEKIDILVVSRSYKLAEFMVGEFNTTKAHSVDKVQLLKKSMT